MEIIECLCYEDRRCGARESGRKVSSVSSVESPTTRMKSLVVIFLLAIISLSLCADSETNDNSISGGDDEVGTDRSGGDGSVEDRGGYYKNRYKRDSELSDEEAEAATRLLISVGASIFWIVVCCCCIGFCVWFFTRSKESHQGAVYNAQPAAPPPTAVPMHIQQWQQPMPNTNSWPTQSPQPYPAQPMYQPNGTGPWNSPNTNAGPMPTSMPTAAGYQGSAGSL